MEETIKWEDSTKGVLTLITDVTVEQVKGDIDKITEMLGNYEKQLEEVKKDAEQGIKLTNELSQFRANVELLGKYQKQEDAKNRLEGLTKAIKTNKEMLEHRHEMMKTIPKK